MSDLISRQAAIDAFDKQIWSDIDIPICKEIRSSVKKTIEQLPSAQPERKTGWIPCSERMPGENGRYLVTNSAWGSMEVDWNAWLNGEWLYPDSKPIAWMPLPEPYKSKDGGGA